MVKHYILPLIAGAVLSLAAQPAFAKTIDLEGTQQTATWDKLKVTDHVDSGYPGFPGTGAWPEPIMADNGVDGVMKTANGLEPNMTPGPFFTLGRGVFPAGDGLYFGGTGDPDPNGLAVFGATLQITGASILTDVKTIIFQIDISQANGHDFYSAPVLTLNEGITISLQSVYKESNGIVEGGPGGEGGERNIYYFQWDIDGFVPEITGYNITFSGSEHISVFGMQVDQSDHTYGSVQAIPEPSTWGLLILSGGMFALHMRRRSRRAATA